MSQRLAFLRIMGGPIEGLPYSPQYDSAMTVCEVSEGPELGYHDAERHQLLGRCFLSSVRINYFSLDEQLTVINSFVGSLN